MKQLKHSLGKNINDSLKKSFKEFKYKIIKRYGGYRFLDLGCHYKVTGKIQYGKTLKTFNRIAKIFILHENRGHIEQSFRYLGRLIAEDKRGEIDERWIKLYDELFL